MFKKPFNREIGELRNCNTCNKDWHTFKPVWRCPKCACEYQKEHKRNEMALKVNYPFNNRTNEALARFNRISRELNKAWKTGDRKIINEHYDKQLKEVIDLGIWEWIFDRRSNDAKKEKVKKSRNTTRKDFPDTRGHYEY